MVWPSGCFSGHLGVSVAYGVWEFQLVGVFVYFSGLMAKGVSIVWVAYMYIFSDQRFTNHVQVAS